MKFRDDIDPANTWVISDTHFGHENIVGFCFRPEDHEQVMIAQWRATVPDGATLLHLGDICYGHKGGNTRFRRLTSKELTGERKLLIAGNHDNQRYSFYRDSGFKVVRPFAINYMPTCPDDCGSVCDECGSFPIAPFTVSFSHYPWDFEDEGRDMLDTDLRIHGHIHNNGYSRGPFVPFLKQHVNVSAEQLRYTPVNLKVLLDAVLVGCYEKTTEDQLAEARFRRQTAINESRTNGAA